MAGQSSQTRVMINFASAFEIKQGIPGVGPAAATAIMRKRLHEDINIDNFVEILKELRLRPKEGTFRAIDFTPCVGGKPWGAEGGRTETPRQTNVREDLGILDIQRTCDEGPVANKEDQRYLTRTRQSTIPKEEPGERTPNSADQDTFYESNEEDCNTPARLVREERERGSTKSRDGRSSVSVPENSRRPRKGRSTRSLRVDEDEDECFRGSTKSRSARTYKENTEDLNSRSRTPKRKTSSRSFRKTSDSESRSNDSDSQSRTSKKRTPEKSVRHRSERSYSSDSEDESRTHKETSDRRSNRRYSEMVDKFTPRKSKAKAYSRYTDDRQDRVTSRRSKVKEHSSSRLEFSPEGRRYTKSTGKDGKSKGHRRYKDESRAEDGHRRHYERKTSSRGTTQTKHHYSRESDGSSDTDYDSRERRHQRKPRRRTQRRQSSSSLPDVRATRRSHQNLMRTMPKNLTFDGTTRWASFKQKFLRYMDIYRLTEEEGLSVICFCLTGKAADFHDTITDRQFDISFRRLMKKLEKRFGLLELKETTAARFQQASQMSGETLEDWADRVMTLATLAFEGLPEEYSDQQSIVKFCQGAFDKEAGQQACIMRPRTMDRAIDQVRYNQHTHQIMYGK